MTIDYYYEFLTLAETQNFITTAERCYISVDTLQRHMRSLEYQFGTILFQQKGNKASLSEAGKALVPYAQTIVNAQESYHQSIKPVKQTAKHRYKVATTVPLSFYGMTDVIQSFQREHDISGIDIHLDSPQKVIADLLEEKYDFAVVWHLDELPYRLTAIPLKKISAAVLMPSSHYLAAKESVPVSDLEGEGLLLLENYLNFYNHVIHLCRESGFTPIIRATATHGRSIEELVLGKVGLGLLPIDTVTNFPSDIVSRPVSPAFEAVLDIVYKAPEYSKKSGALMKYLKKTFS
ncbi:MAG: LysR family transcriptional regulator [Lachnospiraceae bacterium]|jgi:DNA-binding transcriptional LysR family regulator|nr:LysR family transcriptional regulator [Lachnospiraceae bacterium]